MNATTAAAADGSPLVLVVDDSPLQCRMAGAIIAKQLGWRVIETASAREALERLASDQPTLVLTDLQMPEMDGLQLLDAIHQRQPQLPIVLMTGVGNETIALQALARGAASYVPKNDLLTNLADTLEQVLAASRRHHERRRLLDSFTDVEFRGVLDNDRTLIPALVSFLQEQLEKLQLCEESARIRVGVALEEALLNAIYHGNLEVSSDLRQQGDALFHQTADLRRGQLPYSERRVHFAARLSRREAVFVVRDEGPGFNPATLPDPTDPANLERISGRGLLLIQTFMDDVKFNTAGNEITMTKRADKRHH